MRRLARAEAPTGRRADGQTGRRADGQTGRRADGPTGAGPTGRRAQGRRAQGRRADGPTGRRADGRRADGRRADGRRADGRRADRRRADELTALPASCARRVRVPGIPCAACGNVGNVGSFRGVFPVASRGMVTIRYRMELRKLTIYIYPLSTLTTKSKKPCKSSHLGERKQAARHTDGARIADDKTAYAGWRK